LDGNNSEAENDRHDHSHESAKEMFDTWSYESSQPFSLDTLSKMVQKELPASIYRCKGIVYTADQPDKRFSLQIVGHKIANCHGSR
jgi:G3E family GTPase